MLHHQHLSPFYCQMLFPSPLCSIAPFVYPFINWWTFVLFPCLGCLWLILPWTFMYTGFCTPAFHVLIYWLFLYFLFRFFAYSLIGLSCCCKSFGCKSLIHNLQMFSPILWAIFSCSCDASSEAQILDSSLVYLLLVACILGVISKKLPCNPNGTVIYFLCFMSFTALGFTFSFLIHVNFSGGSSYSFEYWVVRTPFIFFPHWIFLACLSKINQS